MVLPVWIIAAIVAATLQVVAYVITPKPKGPKPDAVQQADSPTASAGKPMGVIFGTVTVKEVNVLGFWDKSVSTYEIRA